METRLNLEIVDRNDRRDDFDVDNLNGNHGYDEDWPIKEPWRCLYQVFYLGCSGLWTRIGWKIPLILLLVAAAIVWLVYAILPQA